MRSLVDVRARGLFTAAGLFACACSGQAAPAVPWPEPPVFEPAPIYVTPDAPIPSIVGAACDGARPCGPELTCEASPGGTCAMPCTLAGAPCGDGDGGVCVEYPTRDVCRARCTRNAECRADEGYACDPVWKGCVLANAPTIAPLACPPPTGFGRDPAFGAPLALGGNAAEPAGVLAGDGSVIAVLEDPGTRRLRVARVDVARAQVVESELATGWGLPAIAREGDVVHVAMASGTQVALTSSRDRGTTWSPPVVIAERACTTGACAPAIAIGSDPQRRRVLYVAYAEGGGIRVRASRDGGATFGAPTTALPASRASLAISGDGTLHVVALRGSVRGSYGAGDHEILYASSTNAGRSFGKPLAISRTGERLPFYFGTPRIEVDSARKWIYIAYTRGGRDGRWDLALVAIKDLRKPWIRTRLGDDGSCPATYLAPQLALDPATGALHLAWYDSRGPRYAHGACFEGLRACRQLGRLDAEPWPGLSLAPGRPLSPSESTALLVDGRRRLLHAVWSQPVGSSSAPEARIFHAKAKLPLR